MVYIFLADGFEDTEAIAPLDLLRRADIDVTTVGIAGQDVTSSHGVPVLADTCAGKLDPAALAGSAEMLVLPGGVRGTQNLEDSAYVSECIALCAQKGTALAAICAAPRVYGKRGYLRGKRATCYPGNEQHLEGAEYTREPVTTDGNIITGKSAGHSVAFGLALIEYLRGKDAADKVAHAIFQN